MRLRSLTIPLAVALLATSASAQLTQELRIGDAVVLYNGHILSDETNGVERIVKLEVKPTADWPWAPINCTLRFRVLSTAASKRSIVEEEENVRAMIETSRRSDANPLSGSVSSSTELHPQYSTINIDVQQSRGIGNTWFAYSEISYYQWSHSGNPRYHFYEEFCSSTAPKDRAALRGSFNSNFNSILPAPEPPAPSSK